MDGWDVLACPLITIHWYSTGSARWWNIRWCIWLHLRDPLGYSQGPALMEKNWFMACSSDSSGILSAFCLEEPTEREVQKIVWYRRSFEGIWLLLGPTSSFWNTPRHHHVLSSCPVPSTDREVKTQNLHRSSSIFHQPSSIFINLHGQITSRSTSASPATLEDSDLANATRWPWNALSHQRCDRAIDLRIDA